MGFNSAFEGLIPGKKHGTVWTRGWGGIRSPLGYFRKENPGTWAILGTFAWRILVDSYWLFELTHRSHFYWLLLEHGVDRVSRKVGKRLPLYAAQKSKKENSDLLYSMAEVWKHTRKKSFSPAGFETPNLQPVDQSLSCLFRSVCVVFFMPSTYELCSCCCRWPITAWMV